MIRVQAANDSIWKRMLGVSLSVTCFGVSLTPEMLHAMAATRGTNVASVWVHHQPEIFSAWYKRNILIL